MVVEVLLQVGECTFNLVVGVGHPLAILPLVGEKIREIEVYAVHGRPQPTVGELCLARLQHRAPHKRVVPLVLPSAVVALEVLLLRRSQAVDKHFQGSCRPKLRILSEIAMHDLHHVELAHLDLVRGEQTEQALSAVYDKAFYHVATSFDAAYGVRIVRIGLAPDEVHIQRQSCRIVKAKHHAPVVPPVGGIKVHVSASFNHGLFPFHGHVAQAALDGRIAYAKSLGQFGNGLLVGLVQLPEAGLGWQFAVTELIAAIPTTECLDSFPFPVFLRVQRAAHWTFALVHTNCILRVLKLS